MARDRLAIHETINRTKASATTICPSAHGGADETLYPKIALPLPFNLGESLIGALLLGLEILVVLLEKLFDLIDVV